ncbi:ATP-dependent DNA helicase RecG [Caviibacter abscessus]|uniref:ATP-dependent DNA helicase RecG n=1 Tax=Caviibacter abscessus TaxID=1766719 RepID=UPI000834DA18|nr:ATP-dependent DNA helicase RecG [Caviibacter abscessus]
MISYELLYSDIDDLKIKGLTQNLKKILKKLGIKNIYDILYYFPRTYENSAKLKGISQVKHDENVVLYGNIVNITRKMIGPRKVMVTAYLQDDSGIIELIWFNNNYVYHSIKMGDNISVFGKVNKKLKLQIINPSYRKGKLEISSGYELEPVYPLTNGITQKKLRDFISNIIDKYGYLLFENMPSEFITSNKIVDRLTAISNIHFPKNKVALDMAIRRFTFEEIIILEMCILKNRYFIDKLNNNIYKLEGNKELVKKFIKSLPYELTNAQKKVITTIYKEINSGKVINRLIQGDVGSGKTIVALIILLYMAENKYQGVIMAPTEILAKQHYINVAKSFENLDIRVELLTSSVKGKKKEKLYQDIENGNVDVVIGTHSLIEDGITFKKLGLTIIDEQHKFGVDQRNKMREKGTITNLIVMSATPIPRSLALTIYGDVDVSIIDELPTGRKKIITKWVSNKAQEYEMYKFIEKKLEKGVQVYIVAPLIEESEKLKISSAIEVFEKIKQKFPKYSVGLLHGKQKYKEKDEVMQDFKNRKINILVSTTVVEVGVDVPNASIMLIKNAERFGLSSLHQLRGRVGRGDAQSYCFLESYTENELSSKRLEIMEKETDGFKIAEEDLKLRNVGEVFGTKQSGLPDFKILDIVKNIKQIEQVKNYVQKYLKMNDGEIKNKYLLIDMKNKVGQEKK